MKSGPPFVLASRSRSRGNTRPEILLESTNLFASYSRSSACPSVSHRLLERTFDRRSPSVASPFRPARLVRILRAGLLAVLSVLAVVTTPPETVRAQDGATESDADPIYAPTPMSAVYRMLELAEVSAQDTLYDLGSGDGRIVIAAARKYGTRGVGIEIDSGRVAKARAAAREAGVSDLVTFKRADLFEVDISDATAVTVYLLPQTLEELRPKLFEELEPGTPVVSHDFLIEDWEPERTVQVKTPDGWKSSAALYRWTIPESRPAHLRESTGWLNQLRGWNNLVASDPSAHTRSGTPRLSLVTGLLLPLRIEG